MKIGEIVQLKSGGPAMTVLRMDDDAHATCIWYATTSGDYRTLSFPVAVLDVIEFDDDNEDDDDAFEEE